MPDRQRRSRDDQDALSALRNLVRALARAAAREAAASSSDHPPGVPPDEEKEPDHG